MHLDSQVVFSNSTQPARRSSLMLGLLVALAASSPGCVDSSEVCHEESCEEDEGPIDGEPPQGSEVRRVVAYLPTYWNLPELRQRVDYDTVTHLNLAFANPRNDGTLGFTHGNPSDIAGIISDAHAANVKVLVSIAGISGSEAVAERIEAPEVDGFVEELMQFTETHQLDGVDVDIEGTAVKAATYGPFVQKLATRLHEQGKLITAAVGAWFAPQIPNATLTYFDFINVMSYDHVGTWTGAGDHSPLLKAPQDLKVWTDKGVPENKTVLGVPFYGYCWGAACPGNGDAHAMTWADILETYPAEARQGDRIAGEGFEVSYNGPGTIAAKADIAKSFGGIMIWELGQDAAGTDSLMSVIAENY